MTLVTVVQIAGVVEMFRMDIDTVAIGQDRIVTDDGDELEGRTDAQRFTERTTGDQSISATLHVYEEETPLDPYWDR